MVAFANDAVSAWQVDNWWDDGGRRIAFGRGDRGFVVINADVSSVLDIRLKTGMAAGTYCNVASDLQNGSPCQFPVVVDGKKK